LINNRQNVRRRRGRTGTGGNNRPDNGSRIDNRSRGNAPQMLEKYRNMAREAQTQGDRVMTEYYLQFADHYFRIVAESRARYEETRQPRRDEWQGDDGYEGEASESGETENSQDGEYNEEQNERRPQQQQQRRDRPQYRDRNERPERADRQERPDRQDRPERSERQDRSERPERPERSERPERTERFDRNENQNERRPRGPARPRTQDRDSVAAKENEPLTLDLAVLPPSIATEIPAVETAEPPKRRGRPKKVVETTEEAAE
jgi:hypothetical protein